MIILKAAKEAKIKNVVLSGGVFQNRYLKNKVSQLLSDKGFRIYAHSRIEANDSGIPVGQIAIANERLLCV
jgi:hydrogenase maturation protein HypF